MNVIGQIDPSAFAAAQRLHHMQDEPTLEFPSSVGSRRRNLVGLKCQNWRAAKSEPFRRVGYLENVSGGENKSGGVGQFAGSWIGTGIYPSSNGRVDMEVTIPNEAYFMALFGGYDNNARNFGLVYRQGTVYTLLGGQTNTSFTIPAERKIKISFDGTTQDVVVDGSRVSHSALGGFSGVSGAEMRLFNNSAVGSFAAYNLVYNAKIRIHSFQYSEGGVVLRDFVPCIAKFDGVEEACFANLAQDGERFYRNKGIGAFATDAT